MFCYLLSELLWGACFVVSSMLFFINLEVVPSSMSVEKFGFFFWCLLSLQNLPVEFSYSEFSLRFNFYFAALGGLRDFISFLSSFFFFQWEMLSFKFYICISVFKILSIYFACAFSTFFWPLVQLRIPEQNEERIEGGKGLVLATELS